MNEVHDFRADITDRPDGIRLVRLFGDLDLATAPALRSCLTECLDGGTPFVVDLAAVTFLGSAGLQVFVDIRQTAAARSLAWGLAAEHRTVLRPFEVTGLSGSLPLYPSATAAADHLASTEPAR